MKLKLPQSLEAAGRVFRSYDNSWTKAREAGYRDSDGVVVIPARESRLRRPLATGVANGADRAEALAILRGAPDVPPDAGDEIA